VDNVIITEETDISQFNLNNDSDTIELNSNTDFDIEDQALGLKLPPKHRAVKSVNHNRHQQQT